MVDNDQDATREVLQQVHELIQRDPELMVIPAHDAEVHQRLGYYPTWVQ